MTPERDIRLVNIIEKITQFEADGQGSEMDNLNFCIESLSKGHIIHSPIKHDDTRYKVFGEYGYIMDEALDELNIIFSVNHKIKSPVNGKDMKVEIVSYLSELLGGILNDDKETDMIFEKIEFYIADNIPAEFDASEGYESDDPPFVVDMDICSMYDQPMVPLPMLPPPVPIGIALRDSKDGLVEVITEGNKFCTITTQRFKVNVPIKKDDEVHANQIIGAEL